MTNVTTHPHTITLPTFNLAETPDKSPQAALEIAKTWLSSFAEALISSETTRLEALLLEDSWWRDHCALTFDLRTLHGRQNVLDYVGPRLKKVQFNTFRVEEEGKLIPKFQPLGPGLEWLEFLFHFESNIGTGKGMIRLIHTADQQWKAYLVYTALQELKGVKELRGENRPHGWSNSLDGSQTRGNWKELREQQKEFRGVDPTVLIIGAGQSGLTIAARLQTMGLSCLLIDKNKRVGDNWRNRYRTLVTHDPVQYCHLALMPFPETWPVFTPKDKLGDWFEMYANALELNVWLESTLAHATYHESSQSWTVEVRREGSPARTLKPRHLILSTGESGEPKIVTFPGQDTFKGITYHGSQHKDATETDVKGKKVIVVGTGNSGHDIAQNYYEAGADVTLLQRGGTYVISTKIGIPMMFKGMYDEDSPPIEDADIASQSMPTPVQFALQVGFTHAVREAEKETLEGLEKAGFKVDFGHDGSGLWRKFVTRGGGYYLDVGASQLIVDGKIKVIQSQDGIREFNDKALVLADGRELEADVVVLATGYDNMRTTARKILGDEIADKCGNVWDLDDEGEINTMWRPSGHPRLWFMGGNLALCRTYSRFLALQIKAHEEGLIDV